MAERKKYADPRLPNQRNDVSSANFPCHINIDTQVEGEQRPPNISPDDCAYDSRGLYDLKLYSEVDFHRES